MTTCSLSTLKGIQYYLRNYWTDKGNRPESIKNSDCFAFDKYPVPGFINQDLSDVFALATGKSNPCRLAELERRQLCESAEKICLAYDNVQQKILTNLREATRLDLDTAKELEDEIGPQWRIKMKIFTIFGAIGSLPGAAFGGVVDFVSNTFPTGTATIAASGFMLGGVFGLMGASDYMRKYYVSYYSSGNRRRCFWETRALETEYINNSKAAIQARTAAIKELLKQALSNDQRQTYIKEQEQLETLKNYGFRTIVDHGHAMA